MAGNKRHRPPHGELKIDELIKLAHFDEAEKCIDENIEFYQDKITEHSEKWREMAVARLQHEPVMGDQFADDYTPDRDGEQ